ncbi:MAG: SusC/RagA family TonB-linked outer membrane protein, partial [Ignavibacteriales bacterium]|nr:SusC/RagA family TonB-linked outer membrane protein [Ignavibacteriales bacterium]
MNILYRKCSKGTYSVRAQFVGYNNQTIDNVNVEADKSILVDFNLTSGVIVGQEVVVVGYGVQQKREVTGSVTSVSTDEIKKIPTTQIGTALQGAAAGVNVANATGAPGSTPKISIRGTATLGNNEPLYIVDGVPTDIAYVNPSDIESMDILKDASMSAIYGSRAANGVIIINTNRGKTGKDQEISIKYNSYFATQGVENEFPFITNKEDYIKVARMALENAGIDYKTEFEADYFLNRYDANSSQFSSSDWAGAYFNNAFEHKHDLSVSGGTNNFNYAVMGMYSDMDGIVNTTNNERMSLRLNSDLKKGIFKVGESVSIGRTQGSGRFNNLYSFYALSRMSPLTPIYANTESGYGSQKNIIGLENQANNPILENELNQNTWDEVKVMLSGYLEVDILKDLKYTFRLSQNISDGYWFNFKPSYYTNEAESNPTATMSETRNRKYHSILESFVNYNGNFGDHTVTAMIGYAQEAADGRSTYGYVQEFPNNDLQVLGAGESGDDASGWANEWRLRSYFGRLSYAYLDRYLLTANIRRDGSSRFDADNRWGNFPSFSGGWRISNEPFFNIPVITDLKLRAGYGELGLQEFGDYQYIPKIQKDENGLLNYSYGPGRDQVIYIGARSLSFPSIGIQWETSKETNIGLDLAMFEDRFSMSLDYYLKTSDGILFGVPIPKSAGAVSNPIVNSASIDNNGLEMALNYKNFDSAFKYQVTATVSTYSNEVT